MANALAVGPRPDLSWGSSSTCRCLSGWWFGNVWNMFYDFPLSWEFHHPNWRTRSFSRWVGIPPTGYFFGLSSRVSIFRGAPDGPSCNPRQSENQGPIHGFTLKLITGWWFGTCFTFPYVGKKNPKKPPTIIYIYIYTYVLCLWFPYVQCIKPNMSSSNPAWPSNLPILKSCRVSARWTWRFNRRNLGLVKRNCWCTGGWKWMC